MTRMTEFDWLGCLAADLVAKMLVVKPLSASHKMRKRGIGVHAIAPTINSWEGGEIYGETEEALRIKFRSIAREHLWRAATEKAREQPSLSR